MAHQEPDHVPLWCLWRGAWSGDVTATMPIPIADQCRRVEAVLAMGLDDTLLLKPPGPREDEVARPEWLAPVTWHVRREGPRLVKEYHTPEGPLRQAVRRPEDWPFGEDIALWSDLNVIHGAEYPVKGRDDLPALRQVLRPPTAGQLAEFRGQARDLRAFAQRHGVLLEGGWVTIVDAAAWLVGLDHLIWHAVDDPDFVAELLEVIYEWERPRLELLLEARVDLVVHSAWYEMPRFWSPRRYRELIEPVLRREVALSHGAGVPFCYILSAGASLIMDDLLDLGVDAVRGVDPVQGHGDEVALIKRTIGSRVAIWGGVNAAVTLERGTPEEIRVAVDEAIRTGGPGGGFVLYPVDQIWAHTPWRNVEVLIARWREVGRYPLAL